MARKERAPASAPKLGFPGPRPQPAAPHAGPGPAASFGGRAGTVLTEGRPAAGSREAESPGPGASSWSWRRPVAVLPGPAARSPPSQPAGYPPAALRASRSCSPSAGAPAPALTHATPGAMRPRPFYIREHRRAVPRTQPPPPPALTRCLRRSAALCFGRRSPPSRPRWSQHRSPQPSLSRPHPDPLGLSLFSRRNCSPALRPSSSAPSPLITPSTHPGPAPPSPPRARM